MISLKRNNIEKTFYYPQDTCSIEQIDVEINSISRWKTNENQFLDAFCVNCKEPPCMVFEQESMDIGIKGMPGVMSNKVCPTDAIRIVEDSRPEVQKDLCISCGLCLSRCPYSAINFDDDQKAFINKQSNNSFYEKKIR